MFSWPQLDFSALPIPVSISAVSLTSRKTWKNVNSKKRLQGRFKMYRKGKDIRKKRHLVVFVFVPSVFGGEVSNIQILSVIGRNFLLGSRKKKAQCLMKSFTCRSTFLYGWSRSRKSIGWYFL
jgi:hypothetical protein